MRENQVVWKITISTPGQVVTTEKNDRHQLKQADLPIKGIRSCELGEQMKAI